MLVSEDVCVWRAVDEAALPFYSVCACVCIPGYSRVIRSYETEWPI